MTSRPLCPSLQRRKDKKPSLDQISVSLARDQLGLSHKIQKSLHPQIVSRQRLSGGGWRRAKRSSYHIAPLSYPLTIIPQTIQPTTTLQALVNLKRPTLRLSPIEIQPLDDPSDDVANAESRNNHALEFEFDCDAPKCCVTVQVIAPSNEQNTHESFHRITVYESIFEGGFGRLLKLEDGATIDLGRFEHMAPHGSPVVGAEQSSPKVDKDLTTAEVTELPEVSSQLRTTPTPTPDHQENARKRRFTALSFRRRSHNPAVSGPALAVVDNDTTTINEAGGREKDIVNDDGVRIVIQLVALDDFGKELSSVNRQSTYLNVVRLGSAVAGGEENRSWVVKVVKREATVSISYSIDAHIPLTLRV